MTRQNAVSRLLLAVLICGPLGGAALAAQPDKDTPGGPATVAVRPAPVEFAQKATEGLFDILHDPKLQGDLHIQERYDAVRKDSNKNFDWEGMARRALGRHWRRRSESERKEFTEMFSDLIANTYLNTIERNLDTEIRYEGEQIEEDYATVKTIAVTNKGTEVPIVYWVRKADVPNPPPATGTRPSWLVYDVQIEGVSMVRNYRSQFNEVIVGSSYAKLVDRLKTKVTEAAEERAEKAEKAAAEAAEEDAQ